MRSALIVMAALVIAPFYVVGVLCVGHDPDRSVNPFYINEPRRLPDPQPPAFSLHAYSGSICLEMSLGPRHLVINPSYFFALFVSAMAPILLFLSRNLIMKPRPEEASPAKIIGIVWTIVGVAMFVAFIISQALFVSKVSE